jgi:hypothetical protein
MGCFVSKEARDIEMLQASVTVDGVDMGAGPRKRKAEPVSKPRVSRFLSRCHGGSQVFWQGRSRPKPSEALIERDQLFPLPEEQWASRWEPKAIPARPGASRGIQYTASVKFKRVKSAYKKL